MQYIFIPQGRAATRMILSYLPNHFMCWVKYVQAGKRVAVLSALWKEITLGKCFQMGAEYQVIDRKDYLMTTLFWIFCLPLLSCELKCVIKLQQLCKEITS